MDLLSLLLPYLKPGSDDGSSDGEETWVSAADLEALISGRYPIPPEGDGEPCPAPEGLGKWVCAQPSSQKVTNHNAHITEKLEVLAKAYSVQGDKWRALGYTKAINALKSFHKPVASYQVPRGQGRVCRGLGCGLLSTGKRLVEALVTSGDQVEWLRVYGSGTCTKGKTGEGDETDWQNLDNYTSWLMVAWGFVTLFCVLWNFSHNKVFKMFRLWRPTDRV